MSSQLGERKTVSTEEQRFNDLPGTVYAVVMGEVLKAHSAAIERQEAVHAQCIRELKAKHAEEVQRTGRDRDIHYREVILNALGAAAAVHSPTAKEGTAFIEKLLSVSETDDIQFDDVLPYWMSYV